jgi:hypothetical protein
MRYGAKCRTLASPHVETISARHEAAMPQDVHSHADVSVSPQTSSQSPARFRTGMPMKRYPSTCESIFMHARDKYHSASAGYIASAAFALARSSTMASMRSQGVTSKSQMS